jgi:hypothetical protein
MKSFRQAERHKQRKKVFFIYSKEKLEKETEKNISLSRSRGLCTLSRRELQFLS